ncbi:hypothetical protein R1080702_083 [Cyanophage S-RIM32]|uniref:Uncharacterized protein n=1 Tax=Cyanophage S-RIM32 TaxID=1278479 RepID=A0A127KLX6_9CAUD|nr:hypothetical protein BJD26_gp173 [Cyanophage S-RIM32]AMO43092.1 hypothetical protein R1080702_083 [Cyanophage S-RIM32]
MLTIKETESSAIKEIEIIDDNIRIIFNSSEKEYNYTIKSENFVNSLQQVINSKESLGKFINNSIKNEEIVIITK